MLAELDRPQLDAPTGEPPVRHIAEGRSGSVRALCGTPRTRPLDPSLWFRDDEQFCAVCLDLAGVPL